MSRTLFAAAFVLGALAVVWIATGFVGANMLALAVTLVIAVAYAIGFLELRQFRFATASLVKALGALPEQQGAQTPALDTWLAQVHPSLQNPVRLRVEGERVGLPAPVITPYLVGLLVMLGLLGTFIGMVDTLHGAVAALEGSTELAAIRSGLAAPINGLGLAFGTSVAGVAASAMLGLSSTLSRRDRLDAARDLDRKVAGALRQYSLYYNRQETYKAMQQQAQLLPQLAQHLQGMSEQLLKSSEGLADSLLANQQSFQQSVASAYEQLASKVDQSLKISVAESSRLMADNGRLAGESIQPVITAAMTELSGQLQRRAEQTHERLTETAQQQLQGINEQLTELSAKTLDGFSERASTWISEQQTRDQQRLEDFVQRFEQSQQQSVTAMQASAASYTENLQKVSTLQQQAYETASDSFGKLSGQLTQQWQELAEQHHHEQAAISKLLHESAENLQSSAQQQATQLLSEVGGLLESSEALLQARMQSESLWLEEHKQRMQELTSELRTELEDLRGHEELRAQEALQRMDDLQTAAAEHLASLGAALEEPMLRLIETAAETPRAAAEVIAQLRDEVSKNLERDNSLMEERQHIVSELNTVLAAMVESSANQREVIETLVSRSTDILQTVSDQFASQVDKQTDKMVQMSDQVLSSSSEMASLGESFELAIQLFNDSNTNLVDKLESIEQALEKSSGRSEEQLEYYIAQARGIIDYSISSQKEIFEELRQLGQQQGMFEMAEA